MGNPGWNYFGCIIPGGGDSLRLRIDLRNFERGNVAYVDDIRVPEILSTGKAVNE
jgi:hypothetical protein